MGLENDFQEFENDVTGQGGNDGDNNANNSNGSNDKTEDTLVDSGISLTLPSSFFSSHPLHDYESLVFSNIQQNIASPRPTLVRASAYHIIPIAQASINLRRRKVSPPVSTRR